jgi:hypothetical protein
MAYGERQRGTSPFGVSGIGTDERGSPMSYGMPSNYGTRYRDKNSDTYATDTYADLTRSEYSDYKTRFQPYEEKLMSLADSEAMLDDQLSKISANGVSRYKKAQTNSALMNQRYGVQSSARENSYNNTQLDGRRGLDISQAKNMSRLQSEDSKANILSGAGTTRQLANNQG